MSHWDAVQRAIGLGPADVAYVVTPLYHQSGLRHTTLVIWLAGGRAHLATHFSPRTFWLDLDRCGATYTCLVPTMRAILQAATPEQSMEDWPVRGPGHCYGSTETGVPVIVPHGTAVEEMSFYQSYRPEAPFAGWPTPGCDIKIAGEAETAVQGMIGEILVKSPGGVRYYWGDPAATEAAFDGDWFRSGDQGLRGPNGSIYFLDRLRDLVRKGGENMACSEIEGVLTGHPGVVRATVFSVPDPISGRGTQGHRGHCGWRLGEPGRSLGLVPEELSRIQDTQVHRIPRRSAREHIWEGTEGPAPAGGNSIGSNSRQDEPEKGGPRRWRLDAFPSRLDTS